MRLELRKLKYFPDLSQETNAFSAHVFVDGRCLAKATNDGTGGITRLVPEVFLDGELAKVVRFYEGQPPIPIISGENKIMVSNSLDFQIDLLVQKDLEMRESKKVLKNLSNKSLKNIIVINSKDLNKLNNGELVQRLETFVYKYRVPLARIPTDQLLKQVQKIKSDLKDGEEIFNLASIDRLLLS